MFPVLLVVYRRLALREEREVRAQFGSLYDEYAKRTPRFPPHLHAPAADEQLAPIEGGRSPRPRKPW